MEPARLRIGLNGIKYLKTEQIMEPKISFSTQHLDTVFVVND